MDSSSRDHDLTTTSGKGTQTLAASHAVLTCWVVLGDSGMYSDWRQWPVCVFRDEAASKAHCDWLGAMTRELWSQRPDWSDDCSKMDAWEALVRELDERADVYDQTNYTVTEVPFCDGASSRPPVTSDAVPGRP